MKEEQIVANWAQLLEGKVKILVNVENYNSSQDDRLLIPFVVKFNKKGQANKMGLLNKNGEIVVEPEYDIISDDCFGENDLIRVGVLYPYGYSTSNGQVSSYARYKYGVVNSTGKIVLKPEFDSIVVATSNKLITVQNREEGYCVFNRKGETVVPYGRYDWIDGFDHGLARVKNGFQSNGKLINDDKWGVINEEGKEVLSLKYDNIWNFYGKNRFSTRVVLNGKQEDVYLHDLNPKLERCGKYRILNEEPEPQYGSHYGEYAGTYAQDAAGYSDDVINDAFDGEPDAYWNID